MNGSDDLGMVDDSTPDDESPLSRPAFRYPILVAYICVFLLCVLGNLSIITVIVTQRSMRTVTHFFLANLAVADLLVGIFCVMQNATHFALLSNVRWPFGEMLCHSYVYVLHLIPNASAGILVLLSVERFIAVCRPMMVKTVFTKSVLTTSTLLVWVASATMNYPYLIAAQYLKFDDFTICTRKNIVILRMNVLRVVTTMNFIVWYAIPLTILLVIYITIGIIIFRSTKETSVARSLPKSVAGRRPSKKLLLHQQSKKLLGSENGSMCHAETIDGRRRVIRLVVFIVLSFALLSIPRYIYLMWSSWRDNTVPRCLQCITALIQPFTFLLMFLNSAINPLLYAFLSKRFRSAIADTFCCRRDRDKRRQRMIALSNWREPKATSTVLDERNDRRSNINCRMHRDSYSKQAV
ncbi:hypothetical protein AB6A40_007856 [Gnathostoma spinigerum]|uniref:G-protein coupled receptors family 1 profile domain-containing protein n=1 Tax=Gnathostoma spinigerum TaxID=75299 RepID=A0ABD6EPP2_9BILA